MATKPVAALFYPELRRTERAGFRLNTGASQATKLAARRLHPDLALLQKPSDIPQLMCRSVLRHRLQKNLTIGHPLNPAIQQRQNPAICLRANQPPKPLLQGQHRLRHLKLRKRIPPLLLQSPNSRRNNWIAGHRKWQTVHDHAGKLVSRNVHTLPKAGSRKQYCPRGVLESLQQHGPRRGTLQQQRKRNPISHPLEQIIHLRIAREQTKRPPLGKFQELHNFIRRCRRESRIAHVRYCPWHVQQSLLRPIKFRRQSALFRVVEPDALTNILEPSPNGEGGGGKHDGVELLKQPFTQDLADID